MLSHATRYITKGFLDQGHSTQFVDMYEAVNQMIRKKVMDSFEPQSLTVEIEQPMQPAEHDRALDQSAASIDELWSTLFGLSSTTENDIPQSRGEMQYRY
jgi:hypothetical protein